MKNTIQYLLVLLMIGFCLTSCTKDFLDREPSDQLSATTFFSQEKDLLYAVNACYESLGFCDWGVDYGYSTTLLRQECVTDNAYDGHSWNELYEIAIGTGNAYDDFVTYYWGARYKGIQRANRAISGAEQIENISTDSKNRLVAEAQFLRAYFYFELVYLYGDVPFLTEEVKPDDVIGIARTNKNEILNTVVNELTTAATHLPLSYSGADLGRATQGAALALKARILLYQERWQEAAAAAKDVMDLGKYSLYPDYKQLFSYAAINNDEVIFDLQEMPEKQWNFTLQNYGPNSSYGWSSGTPLQSIVDAYECTDGLTIENSLLYDPFNPFENRDPRLAATILYPGNDWMGGVFNSIPGAVYPGKEIIPGDDLTDGTGGQWNKTFTGYNWLKYMDDAKDFYDGNMWNGALHLILIRYADVLLMYAEAKIELNEIDQSVINAINEVRDRVNMPQVTNQSQDAMREIVRRERRVELAFEGLRLLDIRRWKIAENVMPGVPEILRYSDGHPDPDGTPIRQIEERYFDPAKDYLWPIPQSEIDISGIKQNSGW